MMRTGLRSVIGNVIGALFTQRVRHARLDRRMPISRMQFGEHFHLRRVSHKREYQCVSISDTISVCLQITNSN